MTPDEIEFLFRDAESWCEPAQKLRKILDLLVQSDLHEERDESDEAIYESISEAKGALFQIATAWERKNRVE